MGGPTTLNFLLRESDADTAWMWAGNRLELGRNRKVENDKRYSS
jgi:hypothetical protein